MSVPRTDWGKFPAVIVHSTQPALTGHAGYADAQAGDGNAARLIAAELVRPDAVPWRTNFIVPVLRRGGAEKGGALALALAERLALLTGAKLVTNLVQTTAMPEGAPDSIAHLLQQPRFEGPVAKGTYLLVDETVVLGSAFANLRGHIERKGGEVAAATTFTARMFASRLKPDPATLASLRRRFGPELAIVPRKLGFELEHLTHKEGLLLSGLTTLEVFSNPHAPTHRIVQMALGSPV